MTPIVALQIRKAFLFPFPAVCRGGEARAGHDTQKAAPSVRDPRGPGFLTDLLI